MDSVAGVYFPKGGMHAVPRALAGAAEKHGVQLHYGRTVSRVLVEHGRAVGVETTDGERFDADVVVLNPDLPVAYRELLPPEATPRRVKRLTYSPSCFLLLAGSTQAYTKTAHHNIHFGRQWREVFTDLIDRKQLMADPSVLVTNPTRSDPSLAPDGRQIYYVLFPTPDMTSGIDWDVVGPRYRDECVARLEALGYVGFGDAIEVEDVTTPADWQRRGHGRRRAVRRRALVLPDRPVPADQPGAQGRGRRVRRLGHPARRRRADGAGQRPARRRADPRQGPGATAPARSAWRSERDRHREPRLGPAPDWAPPAGAAARRRRAGGRAALRAGRRARAGLARRGRAARGSTSRGRLRHRASPWSGVLLLLRAWLPCAAPPRRIQLQRGGPVEPAAAARAPAVQPRPLRLRRRRASRSGSAPTRTCSGR